VDCPFYKDHPNGRYEPNGHRPSRKGEELRDVYIGNRKKGKGKKSLEVEGENGIEEPVG
jgi:hypothetical protein